MPIINIALNDAEYQSLQDEYQNMLETAPQSDAIPISLEHWLSNRLIQSASPSSKGEMHDDLRAINAIEKLITSLQAHGFTFAHLAKRGASATESASALADALVIDLKLPSQQLKRLQQLFEYYLKNAKEVADFAHIGITNRAYYGLLHDAYKDLCDRTAKASGTLSDERAVGRAEDAMAILVSLNVISREAAKEKISAFRSQIRNSLKSTWVGKVFGGAADDN